ncbi:hypothetical protein HDU97_009091 [Phlyctochytrium planicorne]|nr:hypothetical protein HDU97_009091 [Phlyctochytrium planicorne]
MVDLDLDRGYACSKGRNKRHYSEEEEVDGFDWDDGDEEEFADRYAREKRQRLEKANKANTSFGGFMTASGKSLSAPVTSNLKSAKYPELSTTRAHTVLNLTVEVREQSYEKIQKAIARHIRADDSQCLFYQESSSCD